VLSDPRKRAEYDSGGFAGVAGFTPEDLFGGVDFEDLLGGLGFGGDLFDRLFRRRRAGPARGEDIVIEAMLPLETIARGGEHKARFGRSASCEACAGTGAKPGTRPRACTACGGSGQKTTTRREQGLLFRQSMTCSACHGRGQIIDSPCPHCGGSGRGERLESIVVTIPPGAEDGLTLRVAGRGLASEERGGATGDLLVVIRTAPDPRFQRSGADLWHKEEIGLLDAVLGTELKLPTLEGASAVKVPAGTQPDSQLRLRGKGLPRFGARGRGDLYVRIGVRVPERLSAQERSLYEKLRALQARS
jgi:molecular chaperone DnaJ